MARGLLRAFSDRIVPVTAEVAEEWGRFNVADTGARLYNPFTDTL